MSKVISEEVSLPELLAPAGDPEKLATALHFGADAVYVGGERFGLRAMAGNFTLPQLEQARRLTRRRGKKLYLTLNAYLAPEDFPELRNYVEELRPLDIDAYIVSDPGIITLIREVDPRRPLHLSTQANTTNAAAAVFWQKNGIRRVNLGRELSLQQIKAIRAGCDLELEAFVHGAMCMAYSGRCLLSAALTGRSANRGACTHPCRWGYALVEETRPGQYFPIEEDGGGAYILNSRDLCLIDHLEALIGAGLDCLKIEGRMKSRYYVAVVTDVYRNALDHLGAGRQEDRNSSRRRAELETVSHRPYGSGFLFPEAGGQIHPPFSSYIRSYDFVGVLVENPAGFPLVQVRNRFFPGEILELVAPGMERISFSPAKIRTAAGDFLPVAQPNAVVAIDLPAQGKPGDLLRRKKTPAS
ncbi:MAG: U32 family peptidase [Desulfuromonadaceae bacterium]|nr:U32 family peptidase [Desulfuromonadaceae bacterium]